MYQPDRFRKTATGVWTLFVLLFFSSVSDAQYSFSASGLKLNGATIFNPTSIQFGPDKRLYISEQAGFIRIYTIKRNGPNDYSVTSFETITLVRQIPNHNDDGTLNTTVTERQITGILLRGTAANPVIYVSSSDSRIGGPSGETNLDTNSGIISMLTWNGTAWVKIDLVRGLPRSEENHSVNGMQLDDQTNTLFLAVGGHTNAGSPSTNFNFTTEYALSAAILSINLNAIMAMPTKGSGNNTYKYDLPTLDDPTRSNNPDGTDINDPFGGNDGLNQAMLVSGGPVQIYSAGYRNAYDIVLTKARKLYTIDNGANQGWGGYPAGEGTANVTNNYVSGEPGSTTGTPTEPVVNNLDNFHYIGSIDTYTPGSFYGGHPCPVRANPAGAGLYTHNGTTGVFRTSKTGPNPLPANWPPVPVSMADSRQGDFRMPGTEDGSPLTFSSSTNGITEYTASNFNGALKGALLAAEYDGSIAIIKLTADGTGVTNAKNATTKLNQEPPFASNFGSSPLDLVAQGDNDIFPGSVWAVTYGNDAVTIFEPQDVANCTGANNTSDDDGDGYTNADEIANGTNPCSAASRPPDFDGDHISDLNDPDDDNDGINDKNDFFALDPNNGSTTSLPVHYNLFNNDPGTGFFGLGFTGLMVNRDSDYLKLFSSDNLIAGGAVGAFSVVNVPAGNALGSANTQQNAFQFGVRTNGVPFTLRSRMTGPFFNNQTPQGAQSQGVYLGTGDQDNYIKIVLNANGGAGGIQVVYENAGVASSSQYAIAGGIPASQLDLLLKFNPATNSVQAAYASGTGGAVTNAGSPVVVSGALLNALKGTTTLAAGIISTSSGGQKFTATWDYIYLDADAVTATGSWQIITPTTGNFTPREENAYVQAGNRFYLLGGRGNKPVQEYNPATKAWVDKASQPLELHHFQAVTLDGLIYAVGAFTGPYPHETPVANVYLYNPASDKWLTGASIPQARRRGGGGAVVYNNKIYLVGGITDGHWAGWVKWFDEYDPATNTWRALPDAPRERDHVQVTVVNNKLYVAGGRRSSASTGQDFDFVVVEVDVYDFATGTWSTLPAGSNIPTPRSGASNVVLGNEVIVIGGESAAQTAAHVQTEALDVTTGTWRRLADLQQGRHGTQAIASNGGIYTAAGPGNRGGTPLLTTQEAFYFFSATTPTGTALTQSQLSVPASLSFGTVGVNSSSTLSLQLSNTTGNQGILISSITLTGAASFTYTSSRALPFVLAPGQSATISVKFQPTATGSQTANLVIAHSGSNASTTTALSGTGGTTTVSASYRINAGGPQVTNSIGTFAADNYFSPSPGNIHDTTAAINGTTDDAIYQSERWGNNFDYAFPVNNGQYKVVLHFAETYWTTAGSRVFDVTIEGVKVLDNYDIVAKVGAFTATTETFTVGVTDGMLNINFSSLTAAGGKDNAKVSAIEVLPVNSNGQTLSSFTLVNSTNEQDIQTVANGVTINLATLPGRNLNIRANTSPATVGSVVFALSGTQTRNVTESGAPYSLFGDNAGNYNDWTPAVGTYTLKATPYTGSGGTGTAGTPLTITFTVTDQAGSNQPPVANAGSDKTITLPSSSTTLNGSGTDAGGSIAGYSWSQVSGPNTATFSSTTVAAPTVSGLVQGSYVFALVVTDNQGASSTPDQVTVTVNPAGTTSQALSSFTLVNASNEQDIQTLVNGATINLATLPSQSLNIRANTTPATVGSVVFVLTGQQSKNATETTAPYALFGDNSGNYNAWTPAVGSYTLKATPYTGPGGTGTAGTPLTVSFTVVNNPPVAARRGSAATGSEAGSADSLGLVVYPNPTTGQLTVRFGGVVQGLVSYTLFAPEGSRVVAAKQVLPATSVMYLDLGKYHIGSGTYYLDVRVGKRRETIPVVLTSGH
ncbi:choice-of-anchor D domain-containing protein [Flaviaesturariibacter flavus]|uniref:Choice-of-anchor D domain-containing protein n=1 Tax=Flaviaesturariibacter flavus TaxID=2502780 RepID=A0A4R1B3K4_9BACT|nr:malectin domain-containing carbohydrate-binding protein [Flaviaesturariibacter flavus]TCJ12682.1 choice-of-anchor D domain-containing protein [Flaviaesturariibacter flavus]